MNQRFEEELDQVVRENRRLQIALKDAVSSNKGLRDQVYYSASDLTKKNKSFLDTVNDQEQKLEQLSSQLKQYRDRNERLKTSLISAKANQVAQVAPKKRKPPTERLSKLKEY